MYVLPELLENQRQRLIPTRTLECTVVAYDGTVKQHAVTQVLALTEAGGFSNLFREVAVVAVATLDISLSVHFLLSKFVAKLPISILYCL